MKFHTEFTLSIADERGTFCEFKAPIARYPHPKKESRNIYYLRSLPSTTLVRANNTQFPMIHKKCFDVGGQV